MLKPISIWLDQQELGYCKKMAELAEIGGRSTVRTADRKETLSIDQLVGQIGQYALSIYLFGDPSRYYSQRMVANQHPEVGDGGTDLIGLNADIKTSLMRASQDPLDYVLPIRPKEVHEDHVYILALVEPNSESAIRLSDPLTVHLVGWIETADLWHKYTDRQPEKDGLFSGAYILKATELNQLPPYQWAWRAYVTHKERYNRQ